MLKELLHELNTSIQEDMGTEQKQSISAHTHISNICVFNIQIRGHQDKLHLCISQISIPANHIMKQKSKIHQLNIVGLKKIKQNFPNRQTNELTLCNFQ